MTDLREMTLSELVNEYWSGLPSHAEFWAELSRRDAMLNKLRELVTEYLSWDLSAPGKQHAVEKWKAECRKALAEYNAAKGER